MRAQRIHGLMALLAFVGVQAHAGAAQVILQPVADTTILSESNDLSNGQGDGVYAGRTNNSGGPSNRRGLVRFDLAGSIPAGATITSVELRMYLVQRKTGGEPVSLHFATSDWGEGQSAAGDGKGSDAKDNDATWAYTFYNESNPGSSPTWAMPGGDFMSVASATLNVGADGQFYTWGSTASMVQDVQAWLDTPAQNFGWFLIGNEGTPRTATRWASRDNQDNSGTLVPELTIDFDPPVLAGACCMGDGSCSFLTQSECTMAGGSYQGDGTVCSPNPCPQPFGACCFDDGTCMNLTQLECQALSGAFQGDMTDCATLDPPCPVLTGGCCFNDGSCQELTEADCTAQGGSFNGAGTDCVDANCPVILEKYVDAMPIPPVIAPSGTSPEGYPLYELDIVQVQQQVHRDLPPTTVWAYNGTWPGPSFVVDSGQPIAVEFFNDLRDSSNNLRTDHFLDVDLCPHGAEDLAKHVTHLHGGHVPANVDGYPEDTFLPGFGTTYIYPNNQRAGLSWYHDHSLGITRLNVLMGLAGAYIFRDAEEASLALPAGEFEVPLIIQDRTFKPDGNFEYPSNWQDHFFGDTFVVNGKAWPFHEVKQGVYRLRVLNGCNSRALTLSFGNPALPFDLIGVEGGLQETPTTMTSITLSPAERADLLIDFSGLTAGTEVVLLNSAAAPFPNGNPANAVPEVMKFVVTADAGVAYATPMNLSTIESLDRAHAMQSRDFRLQKVPQACTGEEWLINGMHWDHITERPRLDSIETWRFVNPSGIMHPMHMHLVFFQVLERFEFLGFDVNDDPILGNPLPILPSEQGWKDTVQVGRQEVVTVIARFEDYTGLFAYHCHILEHEDHEMMRQFEVVPLCFGDANGDGGVDFGDVTTVLSNWLNDYSPGTGPGDANGDQTVDFSDITAVLGSWLAVCP